MPFGGQIQNAQVNTTQLSKSTSTDAKRISQRSAQFGLLGVGIVAIRRLVNTVLVVDTGSIYETIELSQIVGQMTRLNTLTTQFKLLITVDLVILHVIVVLGEARMSMIVRYGQLSLIVKANVARRNAHFLKLLLLLMLMLIY